MNKVIIKAKEFWSLRQSQTLMRVSTCLTQATKNRLITVHSVPGSYTINSTNSLIKELLIYSVVILLKLNTKLTNIKQAIIPKIILNINNLIKIKVTDFTDQDQATIDIFQIMLIWKMRISFSLVHPQFPNTN